MSFIPVHAEWVVRKHVLLLWKLVYGSWLKQIYYYAQHTLMSSSLSHIKSVQPSDRQLFHILWLYLVKTHLKALFIEI